MSVGGQGIVSYTGCHPGGRAMICFRILLVSSPEAATSLSSRIARSHHESCPNLLNFLQCLVFPGLPRLWDCMNIAGGKHLILSSNVKWWVRCLIEGMDVARALMLLQWIPIEKGLRNERRNRLLEGRSTHTM